MRTSSRLSSFALRRRPQPGIHIFDALLETLPEPAFLIDPLENRVIAVNSKLVQLASITSKELINQELTQLFNLNDKRAFFISAEEDSSPLELQLRKRGSPPIDVLASLTSLDTQGRWSLVTLELVSQRNHRLEATKRHDRLWEGLATLAAASQAGDLLEAIQIALQAGNQLTGASLLAAYQVDGQSYTLNRLAVVGSKDILPEQVHPQDVIPLQAPYLWTPGKRSLSSLHRSARAASLSYLASVPIGKPEALVGLLAIGSDQVIPPDQILDIMGVIGASITSIFQNQSVRLSLETDIQKHAIELANAAAARSMMGDGIILLTPDLRILDLNPSAETILGYAAREVHGQPYQNLLIGTDNLIPTFITTQRGIPFHNLGNIKLYRRDGNSFLANVRTIPIVVDDELANFMILIQDLSKVEETRLHSQALEQRAMLGEMNASFAHEVRNPINNISSSLQVMKEMFAEDRAQQDMISRMLVDCDRINDLIKQLLAFAKPLAYEMKPVDVESSIKRVLERFRVQMARVNIQPRLTADQYLPKVEGDQRALEQVWINLIDNAIQAMNTDGGSLTVKIRQTTLIDNLPQIEVSVIDTGPGIPPDEREHIFEPFFTTKRNGTGLGLAITKRIINAHKGAIQVVSIPGGTAFQVQLPVADTK